MESIYKEVFKSIEINITKVNEEFPMRYNILFSPIMARAQVPDTIICVTDNSQITTVGALINTTYTLKVLLVDFTDINHDAA